MVWGEAPESRYSISLGFHDSWKRRENREVQQLSKRERSATPIAFRDLLLSMARSASQVTL
jgi:hypothetical protein